MSINFLEIEVDRILYIMKISSNQEAEATFCLTVFSIQIYAKNIVVTCLNPNVHTFIDLLSSDSENTSNFKYSYVLNPLPLSHTILNFNDPSEDSFWKTLWEKEKMLVTSIFSFSHHVFCSIKGKFHHMHHI